MPCDPLSPDILIRPNGQVELLDRPDPAASTGSYGETMRPCSHGVAASARTRRMRARVPDRLVRGRLVDIEE
jgi:hypothetical protein